MLDWTAILETVAPETLLVAVGLLGTLVGAFLKERFARVAFKLGAIALFAAAALAIYYWEGGEAFGALVKTNPFVNFAKAVSFGVAGVALWIA